jgi:hypothetical protein
MNELWDSAAIEPNLLRFLRPNVLRACLKIHRDRIILAVILVLLLKKPANTDDEDGMRMRKKSQIPVFQTRFKK